MTCDILHLTYSAMGRDVDICEPILSYLELNYGITVERACMRDYAKCLYKLNPKMLLTETKGSDTDVNAVRFAKALGIKVVSVTGEGDYVKGKGEIFFWGWNKPEFAQPDLELLWSSRSREIVANELPETNTSRYNIQVAGGIGFDRYKIFKFLSKEDFLKKYNFTQYKKVIGIAAWGFDVYGYRKDFLFHQNACVELNECLRTLIENNKDILFILKFHPATLHEEKTEFAGLHNYENVVVFKYEENIDDLINVSDLWMGYETTTCLEAWLLGKQTLLINPLGGDFDRSIIASGSPILKDALSVQDAIDEFYANGKIKIFEELSEKRNDVVRNVIEHDDGKNHIRAGELVYDLLTNRDENGQRDGFNWRIMLLKRTLQEIVFKIITSKYIRKRFFPLYNYFYERYDETEREHQHKRYLLGLQAFYKRVGREV